MPASTPKPNTSRSGSAERSNAKKCFIAVMIGTYSPNARSSVEPEMPGSTIADMASAPLTKTYRADGTSNASVETEKCSRLRATTTAAPAKKKSICHGRHALRVFFSSAATSGIDAATSPKNKELTA